MPKEIKMYKADDGKPYKTKKGAENHNKKLIVGKRRLFLTVRGVILWKRTQTKVSPMIGWIST